MNAIRRRRATGEDGSALVLAMLFMTVSAVVVTALVGFTTTSSSATSALRAARGTEYDATSAMQAAIATIRVGTTEGYAGSCLNGGYTPTRPSRSASTAFHNRAR
jgi:hypothetical protein